MVITWVGGWVVGTLKANSLTTEITLVMAKVIRTDEKVSLGMFFLQQKSRVVVAVLMAMEINSGITQIPQALFTKPK